MSGPPVSLHPYFTVPEGKMDEMKALLDRFSAQTKSEAGNLIYDFTISGNIVHCREHYVDADAVLAHIANVGAILGEATAVAPITRVEVHGPAEQLAKLKEPLGKFDAAWFEYYTGK
mmetsp:Transcript_12316/g.49384  ORF Transcript_12316/g.49384 Transcript_12316/m.49384 type:complete len:117 (-) Transcript_12316:53-403(-)